MKDYDVYFHERLKEYDVLVEERIKEYDVLIKERLTECDILVEALLYRDYFSAEDYLLLENCIDRYMLLKYASGSANIELSEKIGKTLKQCYAKIQSETQPCAAVTSVSEASYTSTFSEIEPSAEAVYATARLFSVAEDIVIADAELLDIDAHTRFDGVEMSIEPSSVYIDMARKFLRMGNALSLDTEIRATMHVFSDAEASDVSLESKMLGSLLVKLRYVSELDSNNVSEMDGSRLTELDYMILDN